MFRNIRYMPVRKPIRISGHTKDRLDSLKTRPTEQYEDVIERLVNRVEDDPEPLSREEIEDMEASRKDIAAGRVKSLKTVRAEMGI